MSLAPTRLVFSRHAARPRPSQAVLRRRYSTENAQSKGPSPHGQFYSSMLPDMIPIAILGSAVYLGLRLLQANLSHERYLDETIAKVAELEQEVDALRAQSQAIAAGTDDQAQAPHGDSKKRGWLW